MAMPHINCVVCGKRTKPGSRRSLLGEKNKSCRKYFSDKLKKRCGGKWNLV